MSYLNISRRFYKEIKSSIFFFSRICLPLFILKSLQFHKRIFCLFGTVWTRFCLAWRSQGWDWDISLPLRQDKIYRKFWGRMKLAWISAESERMMHILKNAIPQHHSWHWEPRGWEINPQGARAEVQVSVGKSTQNFGTKPPKNPLFTAS